MFVYVKEQIQNFVSDTYLATATPCVCMPAP